MRIEWKKMMTEKMYGDPDQDTTEGGFSLMDTNETYQKKVENLQAQVTQSYKDTLIAAYESIVDIEAIPIWQYVLDDLFADYFNGNLDLEELCKNVQSKLEIYVSE